MKPLRHCLLALICLWLAAGPAQAGLQEDVAAAVEARNQHDYPKAVRLVSAWINKGRLPKVALGELYVMRGVFWQEQHEYYRAISDYTRASGLLPERGEPHNNLAWIFATCWNSAFRNGDLAVKHGEKAAELLHESAASLDTLAAAYAEAGRFADAVRMQERVLKMCAQEPGKCRLKETQRHLEAYKAGQAWRDTSAARQ